MRVLVVDDEQAVREVVRRSLEREGFDVVEAADSDEALTTVVDQPVDVAVLDLHLPGSSGLELMSSLRQRDPALHVIMLTGAGSETDRVLGLVSGADDYMVKPFSARELAARVNAARRRRAVAPPPPVIDAGGLRIDASARRVTLGGDEVELTRREFDLLRHLAANRGRMFTRAELLESVWGSSAEWQSEATVTEHVRRLRLKTELDPANPVRIVTVRGGGYRFEPGASNGGREGQGKHQAARPATELSQDANVVVIGNVVVHANAAAVALVGASDASEVVGRDVFDFVAPRSLGASIARQQSAREGRWPRPEVITARRLDGREVLVEVASMPVLWDETPASQLTLWELGSDTAKLRELATGIRTDVTEAVIVTDAQQRIQSFNPAAEELYGWREEEVVGRLRDEVMRWLHNDATAQHARDAFQRNGRWHGEIVEHRRDGSTMTVRCSSTLLRDAAGQSVGVISVNRPVEQGPVRPVIDRSASDGTLDDEIRTGIERREFTVHYQPVVRLGDGTWGGVEALVRWEHPQHGLVPPAAFIDAAERSGAIVDLGQLVLDEACAQWSTWRRAGIDLHLAVNLSGRQLADPNLVDRLASVMSTASMPPGSLWLEVTETSLVEDLDQASDVLRRIAELGVSISIDDFGTGWASLTYLREFPVHALKIDQVFVNGLGTASNDAAIVSSIISLGHELELSVIAEGIETADQLAHLRLLGCELGQGYHLGRPQPPGDLKVSRGG